MSEEITRLRMMIESGNRDNIYMAAALARTAEKATKGKKSAIYRAYRKWALGRLRSRLVWGKSRTYRFYAVGGYEWDFETGRRTTPVCFSAVAESYGTVMIPLDTTKGHLRIHTFAARWYEPLDADPEVRK